MKDWPPRPKWRPDLPVDIDRTLRTFAYYFDERQPFVVFRHGTCVVVSPDTHEPEADAKQVLHDLIHYHVDMNPHAMNDGNWMVSYSGPAYSVVFADQIEANWDSIDRNHLAGLAEAEVLLDAHGRANRFDRAGKIGLFGRARMFMDALDPEPVRIWRPASAGA